MDTMSWIQNLRLFANIDEFLNHFSAPGRLEQRKYRRNHKQNRDPQIDFSLIILFICKAASICAEFG
jgi:hypothetical protein